MIRVLLAEDQHLIRRGLAMLLSTVNGIEVASQAKNGQEALEMLSVVRVDLVLTDANMPIMDGVELAACCARRHPEVRVLILTTFDDDVLVRAALASGASGFLLKDTSVEDLASAFGAVMDGGMVIDPRVARSAVLRKADADGPLAILTPGERSVAEQVARGLSNAEIAEVLVLAEGTVKNRISSLLRKLGARDRTALALVLYRALGN